MTGHNGRGTEEQLTNIVGAGHSSSQGLAAFAFDGITPRWQVSPGNAQEVAMILDFANSENLTVLPRGSGTKFELGGRPRAADLILDTCRFNHIVDYDAPNLTVTVEAGVTMDELQRVLAAQGNLLPLDAPFPGATIGGVIATNSSGPRRLLYGSARDLTLGVRAVMPSRGAVRFGGKVMKNVAGYDMTKLLIGSFGSLGVITEVTLRLLPVPEMTKTLVLTFPSLEGAAKAVDSILASQLVPAAVELLNGTCWQRVSTGNRGYYLAIALEGFHEAVERQITDLTQLSTKLVAQEIVTLEGVGEAQLWTALRDLDRVLAPSKDEVVRLKIGVPISRVEELFRFAEKQAAEYGLECAVVAHAGSGILYCGLRAPAQATAALVQVIRDLRAAAERAGGYAVVEHASWAIKDEAGVWGSPRPEWGLMRRLKTEIDPNGILNPGRFVGGI